MAWVYSHAQSAEEYFRNFEKRHHLQDCYSVMVFLYICLGWDRKLNVDKVQGWVNWVQTEYEARKCLSLETAFRNVKTRNDWLKSKNAAATWTSKVDWLGADRVDPQVKSDSTFFQLEELEEEVKKNADKEANMINAQKRLSELGLQPPDRLNPN